MTNSSSMNIDSSHIVLTHQIYEYTHEHEDNSKLTATIKNFIQFIVLIDSKDDHQISKRSISKSQSIESTIYPEN